MNPPSKTQRKQTIVNTLTQTISRFVSSFKPNASAAPSRKPQLSSAKMNIAEAARCLRMAETDVMQLIREEKLIAHVEGGYHRVSLRAVQFYMASRQAEMIQTAQLKMPYAQPK
jgi:hypothetical protein